MKNLEVLGRRTSSQTPTALQVVNPAGGNVAVAPAQSLVDDLLEVSDTPRPRPIPRLDDNSFPWAWWG